MIIWTILHGHYKLEFFINAKTFYQWKITKAIKIADQSVRQIVFEPKFFCATTIKWLFQSKVLLKNIKIISK